MYRNFGVIFSKPAPLLCRSIQLKVTEDKKKFQETKTFETIPGPRPIPVIGNTWRFYFGTKDFKNYFKRLHETYGDICLVRKLAGIPDTLFLYDVEDIETCLRNEAVMPKRRGLPSLRFYRRVLARDLFGEYTGLGTVDGQEWRELRSKLNPILMKPGVLKQYTAALDDVARSFIERINYLLLQDPRSEMPPDFQKELYKWTFESVGVLSLNRRIGCLAINPSKESRELIELITNSFNMLHTLDMTPFGYFAIKYNLSFWKKFCNMQDAISRAILRFIEKAERTVTEDRNDRRIESIFEKLIKIDKKLTFATVYETIFAGVDTTGKAVGTALYLLAKNQNAQTKLREELVSLLPCADTPITNEVLDKAVYLKSVIKESARMHPLAVGIPRTTTKDSVLHGYKVPEGTNVIIPTIYLSSLSKHFEQPENFIPERWIKQTNEDHSLRSSSRYASLPFGFGARSCIGQRIANLEMEIVLAKIIRNFQLQWNYPDAKFEYKVFYYIGDPLKFHLNKL